MNFIFHWLYIYNDATIYAILRVRSISTLNCIQLIEDTSGGRNKVIFSRFGIDEEYNRRGCLWSIELPWKSISCWGRVHADLCSTSNDRSVDNQPPHILNITHSIIYIYTIRHRTCIFCVNSSSNISYLFIQINFYIDIWVSFAYTRGCNKLSLSIFKVSN